MAWLPWVIALLTAVFSFMQQHPVPAGQGQARGLRARIQHRVAERLVRQGVVQYVDAPAPQPPPTPSAQTAIAGPRVIEQFDRRECFGDHCEMPRYRWVEWPGHDGRIYLERNGVTIGGWHRKFRIWKRYNAADKSWGEAEDCAPFAPPEKLMGPESVEPKETCPFPRPQAGANPSTASLVSAGDDGELNPLCNGIRRNQMDPSAEGFTTHRGAVSRDQAMRLLQAGADGTLSDDSTFRHLTIIGSDAERQKVLSDLSNSPDLAEFKNALLVNAYAPDHWALHPEGSKTAFATSGHPTIYLETPDGQVLHHQDDYEDGASGLAGALRRAKPGYDPSKDPDLRKPPVQPAVEPAKPDSNANVLSLAETWIGRNWHFFVGAGLTFGLLYYQRKAANASVASSKAQIAAAPPAKA